VPRKILPVTRLNGDAPKIKSPEVRASAASEQHVYSFKRLATIRQEKGLSLEQIAETTKISIRFLRAIEAEDFAELPGGIFRTSYLRQYAKCVDYDEGELLARFYKKLNPEPIPDRREPMVSRTRTGVPGQLLRWFRK
jgi:cytoskeleton protein RodZ